MKGICPDGKVPKGLLLEGKKAIENELVDRSSVFTNAKKLDAMNEAMPELLGANEKAPPGGSSQLKQWVAIFW